MKMMIYIKVTFIQKGEILQLIIQQTPFFIKVLLSLFLMHICSLKDNSWWRSTRKERKSMFWLLILYSWIYFLTRTKIKFKFKTHFSQDRSQEFWRAVLFCGLWTLAQCKREKLDLFGPFLPNWGVGGGGFSPPPPPPLPATGLFYQIKFPKSYQCQ